MHPVASCKRGGVACGAGADGREHTSAEASDDEDEEEEEQAEQEERLQSHSRAETSSVNAPGGATLPSLP